MRILIACEESQVVTTEFRKLGHDAFSCDILPCSGNYPDWHFQQNVLLLLDYGWDMMIAFPPCTHLAVSGARYFENKRRDGRQQEAVDFFMQLANSDIPKIAIENPVGIMSTVWRKPDQIIQPYEFGENSSKKTCLWLKNLPPLQPTKYIEPERIINGRKLWGNQTPSGRNNLGPSPDRAKIRSKTYMGIAKAMAEQWGSSQMDSRKDGEV